MVNPWRGEERRRENHLSSFGSGWLASDGELWTEHTVHWEISGTQSCRTPPACISLFWDF